MSSSTPSFDSSLVLKFSGSSSTSPSRLPRMFVEYQPDEAEHAGLEHRGEHRLDQRLAGLEVLAADRDVALGGELAQHRRVDGEVRRAVGERHALEQRGVGVEHRRGDRRVVGVDRRLERLEVHVRRAGLDVDLGATPHQIITTRSTCFSSRKRLMSSRIASSIARLSIACHRCCRRRGA